MINRSGYAVNHTFSRRSTNGSGIVEGVIGLSLIIAGVTLGTLLLANIGVVSSDQEKLTYATNQFAQWLANNPPQPPQISPPPPNSGYGVAELNTLLNGMGLPSVSTKSMSFSTADASGNYTIKVSDGISILGLKDVFPATSTISSQAIVPVVTAGGGTGGFPGNYSALYNVPVGTDINGNTPPPPGGGLFIPVYTAKNLPVPTNKSGVPIYTTALPGPTNQIAPTFTVGSLLPSVEFNNGPNTIQGGNQGPQGFSFSNLPVGGTGIPANWSTGNNLFTGQ